MKFFFPSTYFSGFPVALKFDITFQNQDMLIWTFPEQIFTPTPSKLLETGLR